MVLNLSQLTTNLINFKYILSAKMDITIAIILDVCNASVMDVLNVQNI